MDNELSCSKCGQSLADAEALRVDAKALEELKHRFGDSISLEDVEFLEPFATIFRCPGCHEAVRGTVVMTEEEIKELGWKQVGTEHSNARPSADDARETPHDSEREIEQIKVALQKIVSFCPSKKWEISDDDWFTAMAWAIYYEARDQECPGGSLSRKIRFAENTLFDRACRSILGREPGKGGGVAIMGNATETDSLKADGHSKTIRRDSASVTTRNKRAAIQSTDDCAIFLEVATPEIFRRNAFRVTGLPVDATTREISKHAEKLRVMAELGQSFYVYAASFATREPANSDQIREALQKLRDPERRIIDEFMWFWPESFGRSSSDPAICALIDGDDDSALRIWMKKEADPTHGAVAMHNVAILWHWKALELELKSSNSEIDTDSRESLRDCWRNAFKRWEHLAADELLWGTFGKRVSQIGDPRLTTGFLRRMRATLPEALDKVNAELALRHADASNFSRAKAQMAFMRETCADPDNLDKTVDLVLVPIQNRVRESIKRTILASERSPGESLTAVRDLIAAVAATNELLNIFYDEHDLEKRCVLDEAATACIDCLIAYHKKTEDNQTIIDLLGRLAAFVLTTETQERIHKNRRIAQSNLDTTKPETKKCDVCGKESKDGAWSCSRACKREHSFRFGGAALFEDVFLPWLRGEPDGGQSRLRRWLKGR